MLVVASADDQHAHAVTNALNRLETRWLRFSYSDIPGLQMTWSPDGSLVIVQGDSKCHVSASTTVWWRRSGSLRHEAFAQLEANLCEDEVHAIFPAALDIAGVRWVDAPPTQWAAGEKLRQLAAARRLNIRYPATLVTSSPADARAWALTRRTPVVAKATSSGVGIAPYVETVPLAELERVQYCPTMLQELVRATADIRIITVGPHAFSWRRSRCDGAVDWRRADPTGSAFEYVSRRTAEDQALTICAELGLSFSVQDWLETDGEDVFLEVNPQGQWLFLEQAEALIAPILAAHLTETDHRRTP